MNMTREWSNVIAPGEWSVVIAPEGGGGGREQPDFITHDSMGQEATVDITIKFNASHN